ncbi:unnamed protein product [Blepharisma stoltei]|uniref:Uncharacterized protein n=1 Tax=Blepharisma stoltei TaxID=1481888 RepID=A0AAU9JCF9_9CILI|nr:unnamed protein product [Blepharisma stoltei]
MFAFLIVGIAVLAACIIVMAPFCHAAIKIENNLWNNLRKNVHKNYFELIQSSLERLKKVHSQAEDIPYNRNPSKIPFNFKKYWKYLWRISLYLIVILLFSIINITYLYENCSQTLAHRPEVIRELINMQILYVTLGIWASEAAIETVGISLKNQIPYSYPFRNSLASMTDAMLRIKYSQSIIRNSKYSHILSKKFDKIFFEKADDSTWDEFAYGLYSAGEMTLFHADFVSDSFSEFSQLSRFMLIINDLDLSFNGLISEIDQYSQSVIDGQISVIIGVLGVFIIISFIMYFGIYLSFFVGEKKYLRKINSLMEIIPYR